MLMYCVVQTKYIDGEENIPWRNAKEKQNFLQKKFLEKLYLLLMKYKVKLEWKLLFAFKMAGVWSCGFHNFLSRFFQS